MFSVVIPLYNKELSVVSTLNSVLTQSYPNFEIIVVNDGSSDNSLRVVSEIEDPRIRIIDKVNGGVSSARNRGIEEAKYEWICFLDADDLWENDHLYTLSQMILIYREDSVFCTSYIRNNERKATTQNSRIIIINDYFKEAIKYSFFWTSVTCIHKRVFEEVGNFLVGFNRGEDIELWQRIGRRYRFIRSCLITAVYVQDSENKLTSSKYNYNKSTISTVHTRFEKFVSSSEKEYYLKFLQNNMRSYLLRKDFTSFFKTIYRWFIIFSKPVGLK